MKTRAATQADIAVLLELYLDLTRAPTIGDASHVQRVLDHPGTAIFVAEADQGPKAMVTLHLLPNVTWGGRPYGLVENVVSHATVRGQGYGRAALAAAVDAARSADAYKVMLLTGRGRSARGFYEKLGFSAEDKWGMTLRF